jgi:flagellar transcriptional activator FlhC
MACRATQRIRALSLALECARLGARVRTIHELTGVRQSELLQLLFNDERQPPRGRAPDAREWLPTASLVERIEACVLAASFVRLRHRGFCIAESLLSAYRLYRVLYGEAGHLSFDRAFDLVAHVTGLWTPERASIAIAACARCGCEFLDIPMGRLHQDDGCPFCKLRVRYRQDPRIAAFLQGRPKRTPPARRAATSCEMRHAPGNALYRAWTSQAMSNDTG